MNRVRDSSGAGAGRMFAREVAPRAGTGTDMTRLFVRSIRAGDPDEGRAGVPGLRVYGEAVEPMPAPLRTTITCGRTTIELSQTFLSEEHYWRLPPEVRAEFRWHEPTGLCIRMTQETVELGEGTTEDGRSLSGTSD